MPVLGWLGSPPSRKYGARMATASAKLYTKCAGLCPLF